MLVSYWILMSHQLHGHLRAKNQMDSQGIKITLLEAEFHIHIRLLQGAYCMTQHMTIFTLQYMSRPYHHSTLQQTTTSDLRQMNICMRT